MVEAADCESVSSGFDSRPSPQLKGEEDGDIK